MASEASSTGAPETNFFRPAITNKVRKSACPKAVPDATRFPRKSVTRVVELSVSNLA